MKSVYIAHSVTNGCEGLNVIGHLVEWLKRKRYKVLQPRAALFAETLANGTLRALQQTDYIIADVSNYSHGVGFELGYAYSFKKKIILICHESSRTRLSNLLVGIFPNIVYYNSASDLINKVEHLVVKKKPNRLRGQISRSRGSHPRKKLDVLLL